MTCADLRTQLVQLLKSRAQLASKVVSDQSDVQELQSEASHINPTILANAKAKLAADEAKLNQINDQIAALRDALEAQCSAKQPQHILEIQYANPAPPSDFSSTGAATIAYGKPSPTPPVLGQDIGGAFPSVDALQEWKQVLAPEEDYDLNLVGATGWALDVKFSGADVPFSHPFGFDWEFFLALDQPSDNPTNYTSFSLEETRCPAEDGKLPFDQASALKDSNNSRYQSRWVLINVRVFLVSKSKEVSYRTNFQTLIWEWLRAIGWPSLDAGSLTAVTM